MAWGYGTTKADAKAYEAAVETDVAEADVDSTSFYLDDAVAWYGEDETYGTQSDWLTGEGLTDAWGTDPGWGMRSTYSNPVSEYLGENPAVNLLVDAKGMLQRGGKPDAWDIAALGLAVVPGLGPAALKAAKPVGTAIKRSIQDWGKRKHKGVDFDIDQHITATTDPTFKATGFRDTFRIVKENESLDYERALYDAHMREGKTAEEALEATLESIKGSKELVEDWLPGFKKSIEDNLNDWATLQETTTSLPQNITQLPSAKPIQDMTWREWDDLSDSPFTLSSKQHAMMRAQGINNPDNVLDHFWGQGARQDFMGWVEEAIAKTKGDFAEELEFVRLRDLKSGYIDEMTPAQLAKDIAWNRFLSKQEPSINHLAVAEKMAWRPDSISHQDWAIFTKNMTMKEVEKASRKLTLRIVD